MGYTEIYGSASGVASEFQRRFSAVFQPVD